MRNSEILFLMIACALLQIAFSLYLPWAAYCDLALLAAFYVGWNSNPSTGALAGTGFGLVQDMALLLPLWGLNGFSKTLTGFAAALLSRRMVIESLSGRLLTLFLASLADSLVVGGLLMILGDPPPYELWQTAPAKALVTAVAGGILFHALDRYRNPEKDFRQIK